MAVFADIVINRKIRAVDRIFTYGVPTQLDGVIAPGMLVKVPFNRETLEGIVAAVTDQPPQGLRLRNIKEIVGDRPLFSQELINLSSWMADYYLCPRVTALQAMLPAGLHLSGRAPRVFYNDYYSLVVPQPDLRITAKRKSLVEYLQQNGESVAADLHKYDFSPSFLNACVKAGIVNKQRRRIEESGALWQTTDSPLSDEQRQVYAQIVAEWQGKNRPFLIHGITGSGKTEIYLRLIEKIIALNGQAIVLVPEIALSGQMLSMLKDRLPQTMAVLHSGLAAAERRQIWQDIAEGRIDIVVGARSAVFAPLPRLQLIIIDEEHENSYKQENQPRFHALTVAEKRAELCGAHLVLGSATPSVESYYRAEQGQYALGELKHHYYPAPPPLVDIIDMRRELREHNTSIFSTELQMALADTLAVGAQSILFLNRRGYYNFFSCRDCGESITCPHCAVAMSYHADANGGMLKCHYCGRIIKPPQLCPRCGSTHIRRFGVGTQRVADDAQKLLPQARILRLDSDVIEAEGGHQRIYQQMRDREADILVGTQMLAKGLDFPHVRLAAVIAADTMLNLPDWRATERTYQLISQLTGRAGRRYIQGKAIIQTYSPDAMPIIAAANHDYLNFYRQELEQRQLHGYPPFNHLVRLLFTAVNQVELRRVARAAAYYIGQCADGHSQLCGPAEAPFSKIKDRYRIQLIIKTDDLPALRLAIDEGWRRTWQKEKVSADVLLHIDIDPLSMM